MPTISIKYGETVLPLEVPSSLQEIRPPILDLPSIDISQELAAALYSADLALENYFKGGKNLLIIIPDRTRKCGLDLLLPRFLTILKDYGFNSSNTVFLIANGIHLPGGREIYREILGAEVVDHYLIRQHDCDSHVLNLGVTSRGTPIEINPLIIKSDRVFAIGGSLPHYFAVYGGGPKMILPGCSSRRSITQNHRLSLNLDPNWIPGSDSGSIEDNVLIQDIIEAVKLLPLIYYCGILLGHDELPRRFFAGEINATYCKLTAEAEKLFCVTDNCQADTVIVSPGGHPKDIDLLQTHKSMYHAAAALKNGGEMLVFARCREGIGSKNLETLFTLGELKQISHSLLQRYLINGQTAVSLMQMGKKFSVKIYTELDDAALKMLNFSRLSLEEAYNLLNKNNGTTQFYLPAGAMTRYKRG